MESPSRRQVLAVAAVTVSIPMLDSALGKVRSARAAAPAAPAAGAPAAAEKAGWITTKLKLADLKANEFTAVEGHSIVISRTGNTAIALTNKCTHKGCAIPPKAGAKILTCPCHGGQFNLDGTVAKSPPTAVLINYSIRVNADGFIEVDPDPKGVNKAAKEASVAIPA